MNFQTQAVSQPVQQMNQHVPQQPKQEVVKEKPPLPEEYIYLQTVLEELKTQCLNVAQDAVSKFVINKQNKNNLKCKEKKNN